VKAGEAATGDDCLNALVKHGGEQTVVAAQGMADATDAVGVYFRQRLEQIDGAAVVIVSAADAAKDCRLAPLRIDTMGSALGSQQTWDQRADLTTMGAHDAAADMWARTEFKPSDVDVLGLYDGFSIFVPMWLEAFGFCGHGEAKDFIAEGNIGPGGRFPVNTGGGQLSSGRLHGFGLLYETCLQLWGEAGARQVEDARTAVCGMGGGFIAGTVLIHRE